MWMLAWHYHDDDVAGPEVAVRVILQGLPAKGGAEMKVLRIDEEHSNAFTAWKRMVTGNDSAASARTVHAHNKTRMNKGANFKCIATPTTR